MQGQLKRRGVAFWLGLAGVFASAAPFAAMASVGEILAIAGKGEYREGGADAWLSASIRQKLLAESYVRTGEFSTMSILLADQTQIKLGQNSTFQIRAVAGKSGAAESTQLDLRQGRAWSQTRNAAKGLYVRTPSAIAGIHGTDWVIEVDAAGKTALTVFSGEIELANDLGSVRVGRNEFAEAVPGQAPVKRVLVNPAERIQWVSGEVFDPARHPEMRGERTVPQELKAALQAAIAVHAGDPAAAMSRLRDADRFGSPVALLLAVDLALARGALDVAEELLRRGRARYPDEGRFVAAQGRLALVRDRMVEAHALADAATAMPAGAYEGQLLAGEVARLDGRLGDALNAFNAAINSAPQAAGGWLARGGLRQEIEDVAPARRDLLQALAVHPEAPLAHGQLGLLESLGNDLPQARTYFEKALQQNPADYVALTGLGVLELKSGNPEAARQQLLAAMAIEPRYARAVLFLGVAWYQSGRNDAALGAFRQASELDPKDPLPHLMISLVQQDRYALADAVQSAQDAVERLPYLKSPNQLANDRKGSASLGGALALFGLEEWALAQAADAHYPYWAGSHLFLADRLPGRFARNAALLQGFLVDPTVFGADPKRQTLMQQPGDHFSLSLRAAHSRPLSVLAPVVAANGYRVAPFPVAYFAEASGDHVTPGRADFSADARNLTFGLGVRPNFETALFVYGNRFAADVTDRSQMRRRGEIDGISSRLDVGLAYRLAPKEQLWFKLGSTHGRINEDVDGQTLGLSVTRTQQKPEAWDAQFRHLRSLGEDTEFTWGGEYVRDRFSVNSDNTSQIGNLNSQIHAGGRERDTMNQWYASLRHRFSPYWLAQADGFWTDYRKDLVETVRPAQNGIGFGEDERSYAHRSSRLYPRLGLAWSPRADLTVRAAWQHWRRPVAYATLAPIDTAGVLLSDQLLLPGGEQKKARIQLEWRLASKTFVTAYAESIRVHNVGLVDGRVENQRQDLAELERLRIGAISNLPSLESIDGRPVFSEGRLLSGGVVLNQILASSLSGYAGIAHTHARNTSTWFDGARLPLLPDFKGLLGLTWVPDSAWLVQGQLAYLGTRYADEANTQILKAGWDATARLSWRSPDRRVQLGLEARNIREAERRIIMGVFTYRY